MDYVKEAKELGFSNAAIMDTQKLIFKPEYRRFCEENQCGCYNVNPACPPESGTVETMKQCIEAVKSGGYDSAFCARKLQDFLWKNGEPLNFNGDDLPRTQDLEPIYQETSGIYVFKKEVFEKYRRRIGKKPFIKEVSFKEAVDIDTGDDFDLAQSLVDLDL